MVLCYGISEQTFDYVKIFPRELITLTGRFYPQAIVFRLGLGTTSCTLGLFFSLVLIWIRNEAKQIHYRGWVLFWLVVPANFAFLCEFVTIGTMDVGETWLTHRLSAYTFYFITFPILGLISVVMRNFRQHHPPFMHPFNYWSKICLAWFMLTLNVFSYACAQLWPVKVKVVIAINEWVGLYILIFWFFSFTEDWKNI